MKMKTIQQFPAWFAKQKLSGKLFIGCSGLFVLFCLCSFPIALLSPSTPTPETADISSVQTAAVETAMAAINQTAVANAPTNTPESTITPAPTDTPLPPPTQNVGVVGERRETGGIALTILNVSKVNSIGIWTPDAGNVFLVIEVTIENVNRDDETPYNPLYFSVKDSDGFEYNTAIAAPDPSLQSGNLPKGDKVRGFVAFEVRSTAIGFIVTYEPLVIFGGYEPIRINLGQ
jgi:hypothetical protein